MPRRPGQDVDPTARVYDRWVSEDDAEPQAALTPPVAIGPSRKRRRSIPDRVTRAWARCLAVVNELRLAAAESVIDRDTRQAKASGELLAPAEALRHVRGSRPPQFQLSRKWRSATGIIHPPAWVLPDLDARCLRVFAGTAGQGDPTLVELAGLMRGARPQGLAGQPSRGFRLWTVLVTGACLNQLQLAGPNLRGLPPPPPLGPMRSLADEQRIITNVRRLWPTWSARLRRCDVETCYRYFFDASPTASARACSAAGHDVQLARHSPRRQYRARRARRKPARHSLK